MKRLQKWPPHSLTTPLRRYMRSTCKPFAITSRSSPARALRKRLRSTRRRWLEGRGCWYGKIIWWFESFAISKYWLVLWNMNGLWRSIYWECHDPNWRTHIFQRGWNRNHQPAVVFHGDFWRHFKRMFTLNHGRFTINGDLPSSFLRKRGDMGGWWWSIWIVDGLCGISWGCKNHQQ